MKMSKEEFVKYIDRLGIDEDLKIELMEHVTDSFLESESNETDYESIIKEKDEKIEELRNKYKERFMEKVETKEEKIEEKEDDDEEKVIDIKEI